ncbi:MAG: hypothetical protein HW421_2821 [Ignavibacteria bacterium]|nr:hypothetical protein [Ignavibacteria bacterium]
MIIYKLFKIKKNNRFEKIKNGIFNFPSNKTCFIILPFLTCKLLLIKLENDRLLPENNIKELLSLRYIEALANYCGYTTDKPSSDFGVDMVINEISTRTKQTLNNIIKTGRILELQVKATTQNGISINGDSIKYPLRAKNFNDLIDRKENFHNPLILIIFIIPNNRQDWIEMNNDELKITIVR